MFRFANPHLLWLLVVVPVMIVAFAVVLQLRKRNLRRFGNVATVKSLLRDVSSWRVHTKFILFALAYIALVFAAARPQFGAKLREEKAEGVEMMFVVDVSNSMLAEDFTPNRLDRTRYAIDKLFSQMQQDRVGVVVFAGEAKVQLPITTDYVNVVSIIIQIVVDVQLIYVVDQIEVEILHPRPLQLLLEDGFHLIHIPQVIAREFVRDVITLPGITTQRLTQGHLGLSIMVSPCRIVIVDPLFHGIVHQLGHRRLVHKVFFPRQKRESHTAHTQSGQLHILKGTIDHTVSSLHLVVSSYHQISAVKSRIFLICVV